MAVSRQLKSVTRDAATGRVYVADNLGHLLEFPSRAHLAEWARDIDADSTEVRDLLLRLLVRWWLRQNAAGDNPALVNGKTITLDLAAAITTAGILGIT